MLQGKVALVTGPDARIALATTAGGVDRHVQGRFPSRLVTHDQLEPAPLNTEPDGRADPAHRLDLLAA